MVATFSLKTGDVTVSLTRLPIRETVYNFDGSVEIRGKRTGDESRTLVAEGDPVVATTATYTNSDRGIKIEFTPRDYGSAELYHPLAFRLSPRRAKTSIADALRSTAEALKAHPDSCMPVLVSEREVLGRIIGGLKRQGIA